MVQWGGIKQRTVQVTVNVVVSDGGEKKKSAVSHLEAMVKVGTV